MLRVFHTADWHLGQKLHNCDRNAEHAIFFDFLLDAIEDRQPHLLLVSGDIFDSANPSAPSQKLFFDFLGQLHLRAPHTRAHITSGNHDSTARLQAPGALAAHANTIINSSLTLTPDGLPNYDALIHPIPDPSTGQILALVLAVPFLRPHELPPPDIITPDGAFEPNTYPDAFAQFHANLARFAIKTRDNLAASGKTDPTTCPIIAMGHCHIGSSTMNSTDSERPFVLGGSESVPASSYPPEIAYVALGHIHKPQVFHNRLAYPGPPIPLSFDECRNIQRILEVEFPTSSREFNDFPLPETSATNPGNYPLRITPHFTPKSREIKILDPSPLSLDETLSKIATLPRKGQNFPTPQLSSSGKFLTQTRILDTIASETTSDPATPDQSLPERLAALIQPLLEIRLSTEELDPTSRAQIERNLDQTPFLLAQIRRISKTGQPANPDNPAEFEQSSPFNTDPTRILQQYFSSQNIDLTPEILSAFQTILTEIEQESQA